MTKAARASERPTRTYPFEKILMRPARECMLRTIIILIALAEFSGANPKRKKAVRHNFVSGGKKKRKRATRESVQMQTEAFVHDQGRG